MVPALTLHMQAVWAERALPPRTRPLRKDDRPERLQNASATAWNEAGLHRDLPQGQIKRCLATLQSRQEVNC
jgi:hypothetical protein